MDPATSTSASHDWPAQSLRSARDELALFFSTLYRLCFAPKRFGAAWAEGEVQALNPLGFFFTALAFIAPYRALVASLMGAQSDSSLWVNLGKPVAQLLPVAVLALVMHGVLRLSGSRRPVTSTLGIVLYMAAGPGRLADLYEWPLQVFTIVHPHAHSMVFALAGVGSLLVSAVYFVLFARALQGLHGARWWWMVIGFAAGMAVLIPPITWLKLHHPGVMIGLLS